MASSVILRRGVRGKWYPRGFSGSREQKGSVQVRALRLGGKKDAARRGSKCPTPPSPSTPGKFSWRSMGVLKLKKELLAGTQLSADMDPSLLTWFPPLRGALVQVLLV